ncbi:peptide chain release factor 2 [Candidatus Bipolaricaulota bacterium]|nr:peptide chain release factor 2 [Candidatus Bipolaricaulota bacterium]
MIPFDSASTEAEITAMEAEMAEPGFWDDRKRAAGISQQVERKRSALRRYQRVDDELEDVEILHQMATEAGDEAELATLEPRLKELERLVREYRIELTFSGEYDAGDCFLSINAGAGGTDSQDWAEMLLRMYVRFFERKGWKSALLEVSAGDTAGIRSAMIEIKGAYAYGNLRGEQGVHRLVRLSPFDSAHRRHTSFTAVSITPVVEETTFNIDPKDLRIDTYRASGAGGQHVNVTDSAVRITHLPTGLAVSCQNERSQHQNKDTAMRVLSARLNEILHQQQAQELEEIQGVLKDNEWGSQIRSYVLHPYQMVKDHRTSHETGNIDAVLDGDLTGFVEAYLEDAANLSG